MGSTHLDYICNYNNSCDEMPMNKSKLYAWLLSILGFQMQGCHNGDSYEDIEYGCPYIQLKIDGSVKDENGNIIPRANVSVKIEAVTQKEEYKDVKVDNSLTCDNDGTFQVADGFCNMRKYEKLKYEIITHRYGYENDTIHKEKKDLESSNVNLLDKINIVLKKNK
ncbi:MAG: hypothetical protein E7077_14520 [Bacteroidales bacterium]|nr:hypothetical protein [Bacteroidales bacterium]